MPRKMMGEIPYSYPNLNVCAIDVLDWESNKGKLDNNS